MKIWSRFFSYENQPQPSPQIRPAPENLGELGQEAKDLLNNPTLHEALNRVERKLQAAWRNTPPGDAAAREEAYRMHWAVEALKGELQLMVAQASMAQRRNDQ